MTWNIFYGDKLMVQGSSKKYLFIRGSKNYKIQSRRERVTVRKTGVSVNDVDSEGEMGSESECG